MEVEQQQVQDVDDEMEQGLIARRRPFSTINSTTTSVDGEEQNGKIIKIDEHQKQGDYCVYFDTDTGIWKCRICSWDYEGRTCGMLLNVKTTPSIFPQTKGYESGLQHESSANGIDSAAHPKENTNVDKQENGNSLYPINGNQNGQHQKRDEISYVNEVINNKTESSDIINEVINNETESSDIIDEVINEITEYDVETVLKKQETHDLYCPNCNSCITKRVILRKRKRAIPALGEDAKRNKPETSVPSELSADSISNEAQPPASDEYDHQREPDVFRCLSCFSIFMPTGTGFTLFRMFGNKSDEESNQRSQKEVGVKKSWFSSIFTSDKVEQSNNVASSSLDGLNIARQEATDATMDLDENEQLIAEESNSTSTGKSNGRIADVHDKLLTSYHVDSDAKSDYPGMFVVMPPPNNDNNDNKNVEPTENNISSLQHDGLRLVVPPNVGSLIIDNSHMNQELDVKVQMNTPGSDEKGGANSSFSPPASMLAQSNLVDQMKDLQLPTNLTINGKEQKIDNDEVESTDTGRGQSTVQNNVEIHLEEPLKDVLTDEQINLVQDLKNNESIKVSTGRDTIITIERKQLDPSGHQQSPGDTETKTPALQQVESGSQQGGAATLTGGRSLDIVKSMVYGGLMESIASLSVVSSAAGVNAATLNVLALGLANIFGGLFVIGHDLWDLKGDRTSGSSEEDRYQQLLGRRADFTFHVVVCLLSYLVFGFLPPVVYGFSFRESNDRDLKLVMVAVASFICIVILAAGKAYVQKKSYFKTIAYYVTFGFMVSGASYVFGDLIMRLLEKVDIFHSGSVVNLVSVHGVDSKPAIATY